MHRQRARQLFTFLLLGTSSALTGCGAMMGGQEPTQTAPQRRGGEPVTETDGRHRDMERVEKGRAELHTAVEGAEAEVLHAFDVALGKADPLKTKKKTAAESLVSDLRGRGFKLALGKGKDSPRQKFMLDSEGKLDFRAGPGKGLKMKEYREVMRTWEELDMHLREAHLVVERTNRGLLQLNMAIMMNTAKVYADRQQTNLDFDDKDYESIAALIAAQRRIEQLSALATGLMAAYHAVVRDGKDPKIIGAYVSEASKGFPTKGSATPDDAKAFVASLKRDLSTSKQRYERWMKELYGDDISSFQKGIDDKFAEIDALMAVPRGGGADHATAPKASTPSATGLVESAIDGKAMIAFKGVSALAQGDIKGAIGAVSNLVPDGPLKKGLSIIAGLF